MGEGSCSSECYGRRRYGVSCQIKRHQDMNQGRKASHINLRAARRTWKKEISHRLNTIKKGALRLVKKPCKQGVPYKEPQKKQPVLQDAKPVARLCGQGEARTRQDSESDMKFGRQTASRRIFVFNYSLTHRKTQSSRLLWRMDFLICQSAVC